MKILVTAYGYSGTDVSESYSAFQLVQTLRNNHHVTVLTRDQVEDPNAVHIKIRPLLAGSPYYRALKLDYFSFIWNAYTAAKKVVHEYDLVHHISPISFRYPNPLCNLGKPFVWGPVGGSIPYPPAFRAVEKREPLLYRLKALDRLRLSIDPFLVNTLRAANAIVVTSNAAKLQVPTQYRSKTVVIPEAFGNSVQRDSSAPIEASYIFSSGRLVPYKAFEYLIKAFAASRRGSSTQLWITGDGPDRERLNKLIQMMGISSQVRLFGRVSKEQNLELMRNALYCVFPALNEAFGHVNLEAMAAGKAIIVTDWGGPADIVIDGVTGFKVSPSNPAGFVNGLADRMLQLEQNETLRESMASSAIEHVARKFSWASVARKFDDVYASVTRAASGI